MNKGITRKRGNKKWIILLVIIGVIAIISIIGVNAGAPGRREIEQMTIGTINFAKLRDGTYTGEYTGTKDHLRDTKVQATVTNGHVSEIRILKGALDKTGKPAELKGGLSIGDLFGNVVRTESLQVDVISGATLTSKTHLKALENALKQAEAK